MSYANMDGVPTQTAGTSELLASDWNTYVRDNFDSIKFGHIVCTSSTRPTGIAEGTMIYETDTQKVLVYSGTAWVEVSDIDSTDGLSASGQTKLDNRGLVWLNTTNFTSVASVSVNDVFTSTYDNYRVVVVGYISSAASTLYMRLRVSGADNTASTYNWQSLSAGNTSISANRTTLSNAGLPLTTFGTSYNSCLVADIMNPKIASETPYISNGLYMASANPNVDYFVGHHYESGGGNSFDGFTLRSGSGNNIHGQVNVYGYKD